MSSREYGSMLEEPTLYNVLKLLNKVNMYQEQILVIIMKLHDGIRYVFIYNSYVINKCRLNVYGYCMII